MNKEFCLFKVDKKRAIWGVTKYCNYKCKHCCTSANIVDTKNELNTAQCKNILKELKNFGIEEIYFSGGEPFSRNDIIDILKTARKYDISCNISTNGSFLTEKLVKKISQLNINKVHISLDSNIEKDFNEFVLRKDIDKIISLVDYELNMEQQRVFDIYNKKINSDKSFATPINSERL